MKKEQTGTETGSRYDENLGVFASRWPEQAALLAEAKATPLVEEEAALREWVSRLSLDGIKVLIIYGLGNGLLYDLLTPWLRKDPGRHLVFVEDNPDVFKAFLETERASHLLQDPQAVIVPFHIGPEYDWGEFSTDFRWLLTFSALVPFHIASHPANLVEDQDFCDRFMHHLFTNLQRMNHYYREFFSTQEQIYNNFYHNIPLLPMALALGHELFDCFKGVPAIICGAGPSLKKQLPLLRKVIQENRALVFASGSAMNVLTAEGIIPHFGGAIDPTETQESRQLTQWGFQVPFFYRSRYNEKALRHVHGPRIYITDAGKLDVGQWFERELGLENDREIIPGVSTANFCTEIAGALGCDPIILVGMDLAYSQQARYSEGVTSHAADSMQIRREIKPLSGDRIPIHDLYGEPVETKWTWLFEAMCLTAFKQRHPEILFWNATEGGMPVVEIPNKTLQECVDALPEMQDDLRLRVHKAIISAPLPVNIREKIAAVIEKWSQSLLQSYVSILQLQMAYAEAANEVAEGSSVPSEREERIKALENSLCSEPASLHLLTKLSEVFMETLFREQVRLKWHPDSFTAQERVMKPYQHHWARMQFLGETVQTHLKQLLHGLRNIGSVSKVSKAGNSIRTQNALRAGNGELKLYDAYGALYAKEYWVGGVLEGVQEYFYPDGAPHMLLHYARGLLDGEQIFYYPSGQMQRVLHMCEGKQDGVERIWNEEGQLIVEDYFEKGTPGGVAKRWHPNGQLARQVTYGANTVNIEEWNERGQRTYSQ